MNIELPWKIIHKYFEDNKNLLVKHHLNSYNDFFNNGINRIFKEKNPIKILKQQNPNTKEYDYQANIYLGGKEGDKIYFGKPIIYDEEREHYMYPNEARLRNMTYAITIHYDVLIEYTIYNDEEKTETISTLEKIFLGRFPIMLNSDLDIMIIGDSFAVGIPFSEKDDIAGRIRKNGNLNAINYGISGAGPLLSLAVLSEYGSFFSPKKVYYLFFEGNDMDDLINEKSSFLVNYLGDYTQNLYKNHDKVKIFLDDYERIIYEILPYKDKSNRIVKKTQNKFYENLKDFLELSSLKDILFSRSFHSFKEKEDPELMVSVLKKMKKITEGWDGELNFVYIPSWHRYNQKFSFVNYSYKKKIRNLSSLSKIKFIDLVEVFASQNVEPLNLYNFGLHFNDKGYEIISNTIVKDF